MRFIVESKEWVAVGSCLFIMSYETNIYVFKGNDSYEMINTFPLTAVKTHQ